MFVKWRMLEAWTQEQKNRFSAFRFPAFSANHHFASAVAELAPQSRLRLIVLNKLTLLLRQWLL